MGTRMLFLVRRLAASPNLHSSMTPAPLSALRSTSSHTSGRFALELIRTIIRKSSNTALRSDLKDSSQPSAAVGVEGDHLSLAKPLDFDMASKVDGQESQMVTFELEPGQVIRVSWFFMSRHQQRRPAWLTDPSSRIAPGKIKALVRLG